MILAGQGNTRRCDFPEDLPLRGRCERLKGPHIGERGQIAILIGLQDRDHDAPFRVQQRRECGGHTFPIHNHPCDVAGLHVLLIVLQERGDACGEVLVSPMGRDKERMALLVVQQQQGSAPQDDA